MKSKFRTKYEYRSVKKSFKGKISLTDRQYKDDCSIEGIIRRYGVLPAPKVKPVGVDVSSYGDFADAMNKVQSGLDSFMEQPSEIRSRFGNDPKAFYDFITDPQNSEEAVKLGLMVETKDSKSAQELLEEIAKNTSVTSNEGK